MAKKNKEVEYEVNIKGTSIKLTCKDVKRYKHIELILVGFAKLLNLTRDEDKWKDLCELMVEVVEVLDVKDVSFADEKPVRTDYVV